jgi:hypothetical protein
MDNEYRDNLMYGVNVNKILNGKFGGEFNTLPYGVTVAGSLLCSKEKRVTEEKGIIPNRIYDILLSNVMPGYTKTPRAKKGNKTRKKNVT